MSTEKKHTTFELVKLAAPIIGTPLVLVAQRAASPRMAARIASFLGFDADLARATRWASIVAMRERNGDEKPGTFESFFGPLLTGEFGDLPDMRQKSFIQIEHFCRNESRWHPLNPAELNDVVGQLHEINKDKGLRIIVVSNPGSKENPQCLSCGYRCLLAVSGLSAPIKDKSHWPSQVRWKVKEHE